MKKIFITIILTVLLINCTFADSNGIWHLAEDIRPGIIGKDENVTTGTTNFTFVNNIYFTDDVDMNNVDINNLVSNDINTNTITVTTATSNVINTGSMVLNGVGISGSGANILIGANRVLTNLDLVGYATQNFVTSQGYITSSALSGYATESYVTSQGYITSSALSGYATENFVTTQGYTTSSSLNGYATENFVTTQGYITSSSLSGYGYLTSESDPSIQTNVKDGVSWSEIEGSCPCGTCWTTNGGYYPKNLCTPSGWINLNPHDSTPTCFVSGTQVLMADNSYKAIEDVKIGEKVIGVNSSINTVIDYERPLVGGRSTYVINGKVEFTGDHPFLSTKGWKVADLNLFYAHPRDLGSNPTQLKVGDILITKSGNVEIKNLEIKTDRPYNETVYDLKLDGTSTYIANDFVVHNC